MDIIVYLRKSARICVCTLVISTLLLPVSVAQTVAVPSSNVIKLGNDYIPIPSKKPEYDDNLSISQVNLYKAIFKTQSLGNMEVADNLISQLENNDLLGYILYQRYTHPSYNPTFKELSSWLDLYSNYAISDKIYKLALSKQLTAKQKANLKKPSSSKVLSQINEPDIYHPKIYVSKINRGSDDKNIAKNISRKVKLFIRGGKPFKALEYFNSSKANKVMDEVEIDIIYSKIAAGFLYSRKFDHAIDLAISSSDRSGLYVPQSSWVAGLAFWQKNNFKKAAEYFERISNSPYASGWLSSAGSYWAARSYKRLGNDEKAIGALKNAAKHSKTFYGLIATHSLSQDLGFNWQVANYDISHKNIILKEPAGKRIFYLIAIGQYDLAQSELMRLNYKGNAPLRRAVLAYASHVGLPAIALRLGNMVRKPNGGYYDSALYPLSPWSPEGGYKIDPALINAIIRQESRFNIQAKSHSGALGLMQIMPKTALYIAKNNNYYSKDFIEYSLKDPEINIKLGQDYLKYLLKSRVINGDIVSMLVAYNAGPGNLAKWRKRMAGNTDILLFIEMIPVKETRNYIEHVLSNYWIYRHRVGLDVPSLASLSSGKSPRYAHIMQDNNLYKLAAAN